MNESIHGIWMNESNRAKLSQVKSSRFMTSTYDALRSAVNRQSSNTVVVRRSGRDDIIWGERGEESNIPILDLKVKKFKIDGINMARQHNIYKKDFF